MDAVHAQAVMSALAQQTRMRCFMRLVEAGESTAGDLASFLGVPPSLMSSHLAVLSSAGLIGSSRDGKKVIYRMEEDAVEQLQAFLSQVLATSRADR